MSVIESIHIAPSAKATLVAVSEAVAVAGEGLRGDRYAMGVGTFSNWPKDHELTLIEAEVIDRLASEHELRLAPGETRRNITTRGVRLNDLVGRSFHLGSEVICTGTRLCEPCAHLEVVTGRQGLCRLMIGRGGLRARILVGGVIRAGDGVALQ